MVSHPWISALLLAAILGVVWSEYNPEICQVIRESYGPVPPPLPTDFELKGEHVDHVNKQTIYEEIYFDYTNSRAKYMYLLKGTEHHFLLDYETQQVIQYDLLHPGVDFENDPLSHTCTAVDLDDSEYVNMFGAIYGDAESSPKMYNAHQLLRFGGPYLFAFNGTDRMTNRGLLVDKFIGCVYDADIDATMNSTFLFTSKMNLGVGTAGGTNESDVTGIDNGLLSVPVRSEIFGSIFKSGGDDAVLFNHTDSYYWFKGEPNFDYHTFKIPSHLYCEGYRGRKDMEKFPTAFSSRIQKTILNKDILGQLTTSELTSFETLYYYKEKNLARRDYTPGPQDSEIKSNFNNLLPVRTVYDFNQGLLYVSNIETGRCFIRPIVHGDFFETSANILYISMGTPEEIFMMQADQMEYKGKDFTRDIECDVWAGKYFDKTFNATYAKETYISTNGWHEEADEIAEYSVPIKHTVIQKELNGLPMEGVTSYSFLKFKAKPPMVQRFDVSNCIESQVHKDYAILLTVSESTKKMLFDYKVRFLETAQYYLNEVTGMLSPLRVQRLQYRTVSNANPRPILLFTLVDKIKLKTKIPVGQRGSNLEDAAIKLQTFVDKNQFAIKFYAPGSDQMTLVPGFRGSLYVKTSSGDLTYYAPVPESNEVPSSDDREVDQKIMHEDPIDLDEEQKKGMTSTALALLAFAMLFIGIGIGVCLMYLYLRRQSEAMKEDRIHLSMQTSVEVPKLTTSLTYDSPAGTSTDNAHENA